MADREVRVVVDEIMRKAAGFASALGKLKAKQELGEGCELTPDEVAGLIWAVKNLRAAARDDAPDPVCWCCNKRASQIDHEPVGKP